MSRWESTRAKAQALRSGAEMLVDLQATRAQNVLAGRGEDGSIPAPAVTVRTEVVEEVGAVLMCRPLTGEPAASVEWTDAVKGAKVGDVVLVAYEGIARRRAIEMVTNKPLVDKYASEPVATVRVRTGSGSGTTTKPLNVGGELQLNATEVGALPAGTRPQDIGAMPADADIPGSNHRHRLALNIPASSFSGELAPGSTWDQNWGWTVRDALQAHAAMLNTIRTRLNSGETGAPL